MGDNNINILNCSTNSDTSDFIDPIYASFFHRNNNALTRVTSTSETIIDNIFYNSLTKRHYTWQQSNLSLRSPDPVLTGYKKIVKVSINKDKLKFGH